MQPILPYLLSKYSEMLYLPYKYGFCRILYYKILKGFYLFNVFYFIFLLRLEICKEFSEGNGHLWSVWLCLSCRDDWEHLISPDYRISCDGDAAATSFSVVWLTFDRVVTVFQVTRVVFAMQPATILGCMRFP